MDLYHLLWLCIVAFPHALWYFAYFYGEQIQVVMPFTALKQLLIGARVLSVLATIAFLRYVEFGNYHILSWLSPAPLITIGVILGLIGLWLNMSVYKAIGSDAVYYKCEVTKECTITNDFPYSVMSHPLFVGCSLIILSVFCLIGFDNTCDIRYNVLYVCTILILLYVFSAIVESKKL